MIIKPEDVVALRKKIDIHAQLTALETKRYELMQEMFLGTVHDYLQAAFDHFRQSCMSSYRLYWLKTQPERWPWPSARAATIPTVAYAHADRNSVDAHPKRFRIFADGFIAYGPGWKFPTNPADQCLLLMDHPAELNSVFQETAKQAIYRGPDEEIKPPYSDDELTVITDHYLLDIAKRH